MSSRWLWKYGPKSPPTCGPSSQFEPEPAQSIVDRRGRFFGVAGFVGVLDAQDKRAAVMPREEPVEERRARAADVQITGGRRSKADANRDSWDRKLSRG